MTRGKTMLMTAGATILGLAAPGSQLADSKDRAPSVDAELIIAVDVSHSMDMDELAARATPIISKIWRSSICAALSLYRAAQILGCLSCSAKCA